MSEQEAVITASSPEPSADPPIALAETPPVIPSALPKRSGCYHRDIYHGVEPRAEPCNSGDACPYALPALRTTIRKVVRQAKDSLSSLSSNSVTRQEWAKSASDRLDAIITAEVRS